MRTDNFGSSDDKTLETTFGDEWTDFAHRFVKILVDNASAFYIVDEPLSRGSELIYSDLVLEFDPVKAKPAFQAAGYSKLLKEKKVSATDDAFKAKKLGKENVFLDLGKIWIHLKLAIEGANIVVDKSGDAFIKPQVTAVENFVEPREELAETRGEKVKSVLRKVDEAQLEYPDESERSFDEWKKEFRENVSKNKNVIKEVVKKTKVNREDFPKANERPKFLPNPDSVGNPNTKKLKARDKYLDFEDYWIKLKRERKRQQQMAQKDRQMDDFEMSGFKETDPDSHAEVVNGLKKMGLIKSEEESDSGIY